MKSILKQPTAEPNKRQAEEMKKYICQEMESLEDPSMGREVDALDSLLLLLDAPPSSPSSPSSPLVSGICIIADTPVRRTWCMCDACK